MGAILIKKGTKYHCNINSESDHIWLQSFSEGAKYDCNNRTFVVCEILPKIIAIIFGPYWNGLQSYMAHSGSIIAIIFSPFLTKLAIIFGPHHKSYCNYMWSSPIPSSGNFETFLSEKMKVISVVASCRCKMLIL